AITRCDVSVFEVAVGPTRIRWDRNIMPHDPHLGVIALWRKPSNILLARRLADTAEDHKGMAVVPGLARTKLEVVLAGAAGDDRGLVACGLCYLRRIGLGASDGDVQRRDAYRGQA